MVLEVLALFPLTEARCKNEG